MKNINGLSGFTVHKSQRDYIVYIYLNDLLRVCALFEVETL